MKSVFIAGAAFMLTVFALIILHSRATDPFLRFENFSKAHPNLRITFSASSKDKPVGTGVLLVARPAMNLLKVQLGSLTYTASNTANGYVEVFTGDSDYDESPAIGAVGIRQSRISGAPGIAPTLVLIKDLHKAVAANPKTSPKLNGDEIYSSNNGPMGKSELWLDVNNEGEITHYRARSEGMGRVSDRSWDLEYSFPAHLSLSDFALPLPLGYQPYALPQEAIPLQKGKVAPVSGWKDGQSSKVVNLLDLSNHKPFLLAILDEEAPSKRAIETLHKLKAKLPVQIVGPGLLQDPDGTRLAVLNPPGHPMFYLIGGDGKVLGLWLGFETDNGSEFSKQVIDTASGVPAPSKP